MAAILLIDDCDEFREVLQQTLAAAGHCVTGLRSGRNLFARLAPEAYDVVITDVYMPDVDGLELIGALRQLPDPPRILAISGNQGRVDALALARGLGAVRTLSKPFARHALLTAVDQLLFDQATPTLS